MKYFNTSKWKSTSRENRFAAGLQRGVNKFIDTKKPKRGGK